MAAASRANYDESKVPTFVPLNPLTLPSGHPISSPLQWHQTRRPQLLQELQSTIYGALPPSPKHCCFTLLESDSSAINGLATRTLLRLDVHSPETGSILSAHILLFVPNHRSGTCAAFAGLNLKGNAAVVGDMAHRWQVELVVSSGYALATVCYEDFATDEPSAGCEKLLALFPSLSDRGRVDNLSCVGAWAWGLNRVLDMMKELGGRLGVDHKRVAAVGFSRAGKAALWAGAVDQRWAMVISNESGCAGAALSMRRFGETVALINRQFPHWFCQRFKEFDDKEHNLPVDQHCLLAMIAPRPLYVASAQEDLWADPRGEFLAAKLASPVYELCGKRGIPENMIEFEIEKPVHLDIGHHVRKGKHEVTRYDWEQFIHFAGLHFGRSGAQAVTAEDNT